MKIFKVLFLVLLLGCFGCTEKEANEEDIITGIFIKVDKNMVESNGIEKVNITVIGYNKYNDEIKINKPIHYFVDNEEINSNSLTLSKEGAYSIYARIGVLKSNIEVIKSIGEIKKIKLKMSEDIIFTDSESRIILNSEIFLEGNQTISVVKDIMYYYKKDNTEHQINENIFDIREKGDYYVYSKYKNIESDIRKISVLERAKERKIIVKSEKIYSSRKYGINIELKINGMKYEIISLNYDDISNGFEKEISIDERTTEIRMVVLDYNTEIYENSLKIKEDKSIYENRCLKSINGIYEFYRIDYSDESKLDVASENFQKEIVFDESGYCIIKLDMTSSDEYEIELKGGNENIRGKFISSINGIYWDRNYRPELKNGEIQWIRDEYERSYIIIYQNQRNIDEKVTFRMKKIPPIAI